MKIILYLIFFLLISNCSLNSKSKYWTEDTIKKKAENEKLIKITKKTNNMRNMTVEEFEIYIDDYTKKSKYPNINKWIKL